VILGLTPACNGSVLVGGTDVADLDPDAWRSQIAWVPQRPHLFARSIADNIRLGRPDASDDRMRAAVTAAGLDEVVGRLPDGLLTALGHDGAGLSAGERQRVALARAFLRDAPLLLLDEPTANLDGRTEELVLQAVRRLMAGRTVLMVAHRPSLLALADRVVDLSPELVR
jgi:ATP-binding cassette subfamily C protein CydCD